MRTEGEKKLPPKIFATVTPHILQPTIANRSPLSLSLSSATEEQLSADLWIALWFDQAPPPNKHPPGTPSHQTPQFNAAVKDFCSPSMLITLYTGAHCTSTAKAQKVSHCNQLLSKMSPDKWSGKTGREGRVEQTSTRESRT